MQKPLAAFPFIHTRSTEALEAAVNTQYGAAKIEITRRDRVFNVVANHCELRHIGLTYANHGAPVQISFQSFGFYAQLFSLGGCARAQDGPDETYVDPSRAFVATPNTPLRLSYSPNFEQLALKLDHAALIRTIEALAGEPLHSELRFSSPTDLRGGEGLLLHRKIMSLVGWLGKSNDINLPAFAEMEQSILTSCLYANGHNYTDLLDRQPHALGARYLRLAEEYIAANWNKPLYIEDLAAVTGLSVRAIFYSFKQKYGHSPMNFLRQIRLEHSKRLLSNPLPSTSVTDVAFACGFGNLGHFAGYYNERFGESPSETLRRSKK